MPLTTIELIKDAAKNAVCPTLDEEIYHDIETGVFTLSGGANSTDVYVDVPVHKLVSLNRRDFWSPGDTWRSATYKLHGEGWKAQVLKYFESQIKDQWFPAPNSTEPLTLRSFGGLVECSVGNHRIIAARSWLTAKYGCAAYFNSVRVRAFSIPPCVVRFLEEAVQEGSDVLISNISSQEIANFKYGDSYIELLLRKASDKYTIHGWLDDEIKPIRRTFLQRNFPIFFPSRFYRRKWYRLPCRLAKMILDDAWITSQIPSAKTW